LGLLTLRVAVSLSILLPKLTLAYGTHMLGLTISVILATSLLLGFLTPIAALACIPIQLLGFSCDNLMAPIAPLMACSLGMTGSGAYSIDSLLFGRRRIVVHSTPGEKIKHP
jgi:hypothetical protein